MGDDLKILEEMPDLNWSADWEIDLPSLNIPDEQLDWSFWDEQISFDIDWLKDVEIDWSCWDEPVTFDADWLKIDNFDFDALSKTSEIDMDWLKDLEVPELKIDDADVLKDIDNNL